MAHLNSFTQSLVLRSTKSFTSRKIVVRRTYSLWLSKPVTLNDAVVGRLDK